MHSPLISKIRCNHPNKKGSRNANRNHLIYIATREGVDLSPLSDGTPVRSGLFGNFDISDVQSAGNSLYQLSAEGIPIFRGIISLSSEDAAELGYTTKAAWELYMKDVMPDIGREFNIPVDKLFWAAAVHMENGHPHCHYMFWRNDHKTQSCFIHPSRQNKCRELLSARMFEDERQQQILNKTASRDSILRLEKEVLGKIRNDDLKDVSEMLLDLCHDLPQTGRLNYKFLSPELKYKVDHISDTLFQNPAIQKKAAEYSLAVKRLSETYSPSELHHKVNIERAQTDLYTRSGNIILKEAKAILSALTPELPLPQNIPDTPYSPMADFPIPPANDPGIFSIMPDPESVFTGTKELCFMTEKNDNLLSAQTLFYQKKDYDNAINLLNKEVKAHNVPAFELLGKIYTQTSQNDFAHIYYEKALQGFQYLAQHEPSDSWKLGYYYYKIGKFYEQGLGVTQNYQAAIKYFSEASKLGNQYASYSLGRMYLHEKGIQFTAENRSGYINTISSLFRASADSGFSYAAYAYASLCETEHLPETNISQYYLQALNAFKKEADQNPSDFVLYRLGTMYYRGLGMDTPDTDLAVKYFKQAADFKNPNALYALGKIYSDPNESLYDPVTAEKYLSSAIQEKNIYAKCALGELYLQPESPLFSPDKAVQLLLESAEDNSRALFILGKYYLNPDMPDYSPDTGEAYLRKAILRGNTQAQYFLGKLYADNGNIEEALKLLTPLADDNHTYSQLVLGKLYAQHDTNYFNPDLAHSYLKKAYESGLEFAQYQLAKFYLDKNTGFYSPEKALSLLQPLAESGNDFAQAELGCLYLWGNHSNIPQNTSLAFYWLNLACLQNNSFAQNNIDLYNRVTLQSFAYKIYNSLFHNLSFSTLRRRQRLEDLKYYQSLSAEHKRAKQHEHQI